MEIEDENSTGTLHEDNRSGEENILCNQIEDDHVDEEDRNRDKEEYEVQVNDLETNTKMVLTKPIPNQYLTKCKKCQSKNRLKGKILCFTYYEKYKIILDNINTIFIIILEIKIYMN